MKLSSIIDIFRNLCYNLQKIRGGMYMGFDLQYLLFLQNLRESTGGVFDVLQYAIIDGAHSAYSAYGLPASRDIIRK